MTDKATILIVDDDSDIRNVLRILLSEKYNVTEASGGPAAIDEVKQNKNIDLIILDVMMPVMDGYQTCEIIREFTNAPILFLTAKSSENDKLSAYTSGGDDFLSKPFSHQEILAKVSSLLRRYREYRGKPESALEIGGLEIDTVNRSVTRNGVPIPLTETEYLILDCFIKNRGKTVSAPDLYEAVWKEQFLPSSQNTVMVHILNLRRKIEENASNPKVIRTVWGKGYQID